MKINLPVMQCDDNCGECCGPVMVTQPELDAIRAYMTEHNIKPVAQGVTCPLYQGGKCSVHPVRPKLCQAFGHTREMTCPRGYNTNVPDHVIRQWLIANGRPVALLHQLLGQ